VGTRCADHVTPLYPQKLALTSPTGGDRSVGIVRVRTKATEFSFNWNMKELFDEWKESILVPIYKKGYNTDYINYSGVSLLPTTDKILSDVLVSRLTP